MVVSLQCYESSDGQLFKSEQEALLHELELKLLPALKGNIGLVNDLIASFTDVYPAMCAYNELLLRDEVDTSTHL